MSIEVINTCSLAGSSPVKCPVCDDPPHIAFNWRYAREEGDKKLRALSDQLELVKGLKFGELYSCRLCGGNWWLDGDRYMMTRVPADRKELLEEWNANPLPVKPEHLRILDTIGGTAPNHGWGRGKEIAVPCAITTATGERVDPVLVWITRRPPLDTFTLRVRLYRDVARVEPSRFALPMDVRRATVLAGEVAMGFAPTRVEAPDGTPYVVHWATNLFNHGGFVGSEIHLSSRKFDWDEPVSVVDSDDANATYYIADWFDGAEKLDKTRTKQALHSRVVSWFKGRRI